MTAALSLSHAQPAARLLDEPGARPENQPRHPQGAGEHATGAGTEHCSSHTRSRAVLAGATAPLPGASLAQVIDAAALQTRTDNKYLVNPRQLTSLLAVTAERFRVLEIDDRRSFGYESVYFDTADRLLYRDHRQGRRQRFKVRTRTYTDSGECMFEVKVKGRRGRTVKHRMPYEPADRDRLRPGAHRFLSDVLADAYGTDVPPLEPALRSTYQRTTLVDQASVSRLTCDVALGWQDLLASDGAPAGGRVLHGPDLVLLESKSADGDAPADRVLAELGVRPVKMSKYCIGTALAEPQLAANPWNRLLRRHFGWQRAL